MAVVTSLSQLTTWVGRGRVYALDALPRYSADLAPACVSHVVFMTALPRGPVICGTRPWGCGTAGAPGGREGREACKGPWLWESFSILALQQHII